MLTYYIPDYNLLKAQRICRAHFIKVQDATFRNPTLDPSPLVAG
jgi:hypothetical protein